MSAPPELGNQLADAMLRDRRHAWATLDGQHRVVEAGGDLLGGTLADLVPGADAMAVLPCLHGLAAGLDADAHVPRVNLADGLTVDVFLRHQPTGALLLVLDVSAEQRRETQLLQRANELALLRRQLGGDTPDTAAARESATLGDLLHALDVCAVEWHDDQPLLPVGTTPVWAQPFVDALGDRGRNLFADPAFAFLGTFIFEARDFWRSGQHGALASGMWIDTDTAGTEYIFEATAVSAQGQHLLLIERNSRAARDQREAISTGRRQALASRAQRRELIASSTERERLERERSHIIEQAQAAQHIEALGTLTGGIAHDFNNVLTAIIGFADLGASEARPGTRQYDHFNFVLQAGERARNLIREIMTLSSRRQTSRETVSLRDIVNDVLGLVRATMPRSIDIELDLRDAANVRANPTQLHQLVLNLCTNAVHAIGNQPGKLSISLDECDAPATTSPQSLRGGPHARLRITDTGSGIPDDVRPRIFDPFFTTKPASQGTGIGLSVVHGIISGGRARIDVDSEPGRGSTFEVLWPLVGQMRGTQPSPSDRAVTGIERILFVDDDPMQVELGRRMLGSLGYDVLALTDAREALDQLRQRRGTWDMLITDHAMPGLTGASLAREVLRTQPGFPVLVCSGNVGPEMVDNLLAIGVADVLLKPVRWRLMAEAIQRCLHPTQGDTADTPPPPT